MKITPEKLDHVPTGLLIDGDWRPSAQGGTLPVIDPATEDVLTEVADATPADVPAVLDASVSAFDTWSATAPRVRSEILRRTYESLIERADDFALLITLEMGKPLAESRAEVTYAAEFVRWYAEEAVRLNGTYRIAPEGNARQLTVKQPVGPCLLITPWNFPLAMVTRKVAPALAAGCSAILKPAEQTPLTALLFGQVLADAGVPAGVVNIITTSDPAPVVDALLADQRVRKLSFTGSTEVGRVLLASAARNVQRTSMELGGNAPFLVFADADIDAAVDGAMLAKLRNGGESCVAANRFLVHESVSDEFAAALAKRMREQRLGAGTDAGTTVGPLIDAAARSKVDDLVREAVDRGARVLTGGQAPNRAGFFYEPTVLTGVGADARMLTTEIFGPVAPISTFTSEEEAITAANATEFGLVAYAYTRDLDRALRVADALRTGMVGLNRGVVSNAAAPFGGVKQSGLGREGGEAGIQEYLDTKYIAL
ncbi:NAD-dependent succinate-semialdehyde dehydrogenase [Kibdelosporangium persicum]|uniref:NAD-dependent succinate-semialdehyde dehydrogenase n=1 Tax=Kibdelosporangium persicum TaxID=2698649 RepID=A0ABX2F9W9_9PSEU|nr:NAD-dependent succinate-semialdehyde dehydrogenase [Kibdelosporangium persicum]NRN68013.1 NAD-dependent succinate-semialdehyde dehydrogenase [Kibdelosporangium persicum]